MFEIDDVLKTFSEVSRNWNKKNEFIAAKSGETRRLHKILKEIVTPGMRILDVGSGTGKMPNFLAGIENDIEIIAIDLALNMVFNASLLGGKVSAFLADIQNPCFKNEVFDIVVLQQVLHHLPNPSLAIQEIFRILKPEGFLTILTVGCYYQTNLFKDCTEDMLTDPLGRTSSYLLRELMLDVGFKVVNTIDDYFEMTFTNFNHYFDFLNAIGSLRKIFKYKLPPANAKEMICERLFNSRIPPANEIKIDGHYITVIAKKC
ncbi:MAG: hypothetical protein Tsb005_21260 [Gammaproteobacteria bacterium]